MVFLQEEEALSCSDPEAAATRSKAPNFFATEYGQFRRCLLAGRQLVQTFTSADQEIGSIVTEAEYRVVNRWERRYSYEESRTSLLASVEPNWGAQPEIVVPEGNSQARTFELSSSRHKCGGRLERTLPE
jgi:hypothetical protein